jgi:hypothetical protein
MYIVVAVVGIFFVRLIIMVFNNFRNVALLLQLCTLLNCAIVKIAINACYKLVYLSFFLL